MHDALKIGIIGAGARAAESYVRYLADFERPAELIAIAEPDSRNAQWCLEAMRGQQTTIPQVFTNHVQMLESEGPFDGMIIAAPNQIHKDASLACMEKGIKTIALEKPLAHCPEHCRDILEQAQQRNARILLGFVLRSTLFYRTVRRLLDDHLVGEIHSIQADELVSFLVTSIMLRSAWRRHHKNAGGALLEKCCHDIDLLNWFAGGRPVKVSSFGSQKLFKPDPELPDRCAKCLRTYCSYRNLTGDPEDSANQALNNYLRDSDLCIYHTGTDSVDHQCVQIQYDNGVIADFLMNFNCEGQRANRNLHIIGSEGRIWGNLKESVVYYYNNRKGQTETFHCHHDNSGHYGGDREHTHSFLRCVADISLQPKVNVYDGYLSAMVCFAADISRTQGRQVTIHYSTDGFVELI